MNANGKKRCRMKTMNTVVEGNGYFFAYLQMNFMEIWKNFTNKTETALALIAIDPWLVWMTEKKVNYCYGFFVIMS